MIHTPSTPLAELAACVPTFASSWWGICQSYPLAHRFGYTTLLTDASGNGQSFCQSESELTFAWEELSPHKNEAVLMSKVINYLRHLGKATHRQAIVDDGWLGWLQAQFPCAWMAFRLDASNIRQQKEMLGKFGWRSWWLSWESWWLFCFFISVTRFCPSELSVSSTKKLFFPLLEPGSFNGTNSTGLWPRLTQGPSHDIAAPTLCPKCLVSLSISSEPEWQFTANISKSLNGCREQTNHN